MKIYFAAPIMLGVALSFYSLLFRNTDFMSFLVTLFGGSLFYSAPYIAWYVFQLIGKPSNPVAHAGYIGITLSLVFISSLWLLPQDQSGLPVQWMAYWPLTGILALLFSVGTYTYNRVRGI